jgi:hypothetical protein
MPVRLQGFKCINCTYDLSGNSLGDRCPECGWSVNASLYNGEFFTKGYAIRTVACATLTVFLVAVPIASAYFAIHAWRWHRGARECAADERVQAAQWWLTWSWVGVSIATLAGITNVAATVVAATWLMQR